MILSSLYKVVGREGCKVFGWMDILLGGANLGGAIVRPGRQLVVTDVLAGTDQNL